jgi:AraC-like DNA-binding protein
MNRTHYPLSELGSRLKTLPPEPSASGQILIIDEENADYRQTLAEALPNCRFTHEPCPETARQLFLASPIDLVLLSHSSRISCLDWLPLFKSLRPSVSVIVITTCGCEELAVQVFRHGAIDYFRKPLDLAALELNIRAVLGFRRKRREGEVPQPAGGLPKALRYIEANVHTPISLDRAAREAGMSVSCFERHLKQLTGNTFVTHLNGLRVSRARELLQTNRSSMLQIALACGFSNQSHFNRVFRKIAGITPGEYRKSVSVDSRKS